MGTKKTYFFANKDKDKYYTGNYFSFFFILSHVFLSINYLFLYEIGGSLYEIDFMSCKFLFEHNKGCTFAVHPLF